ncbi:hypothetical protein HanPI659440_Chr04g0147121 [Helianthus annuus]|nr:hypothetical protein HanPI659440_Chr04g0147121 [Helianthus annuus]
MPHSLSVIATSSVALFMTITPIVVITIHIHSTIHFSSSYFLYLFKSKLRWCAPMVWLLWR